MQINIRRETLCSIFEHALVKLVFFLVGCAKASIFFTQFYGHLDCKITAGQRLRTLLFLLQFFSILLFISNIFIICIFYIYFCFFNVYIKASPNALPVSNKYFIQIEFLFAFTYWKFLLNWIFCKYSKQTRYTQNTSLKTWELSVGSSLICILACNILIEL